MILTCWYMYSCSTRILAMYHVHYCYISNILTYLSEFWKHCYPPPSCCSDVQPTVVSLITPCRLGLYSKGKHAPSFIWELLDKGFHNEQKINIFYNFLKNYQKNQHITCTKPIILNAINMRISVKPKSDYSETCLERPLPWETTCLDRQCIFGRRTHISI